MQRPTRIVGIAVRDAQGGIHTTDQHITHSEFRSQLERQGVQLTSNPDANWDNGFSTDTVPYVHRRAAEAIAYASGQIVDELKHPSLGLTSADLWPDEIKE